MMTPTLGQMIVYAVEIIAGLFLVWAFWKLLSKAESDYTNRKLDKMPKYDLKNKIYHD